jgi:hypothetical protein
MPGAFLYLLAQRGYELEKLGEKTHTIFENLIQGFSVSEVFFISWTTVRDTTDYIVRKGIRNWHGKNIFIGAIQRKADRARAEGWSLHRARRDYNCPQTVISATFLFLDLGDKALEMIPPGTEGDCIA